MSLLIEVVTRKFGLHSHKTQLRQAKLGLGICECCGCLCCLFFKPTVGRLCFQVLIGDEPEQGMENLMEVEIPLDVEEKLNKADQEEMERAQDETGGGGQ